jgi:hypothetical protein
MMAGCNIACKEFPFFSSSVSPHRRYNNRNRAVKRPLKENTKRLQSEDSGQT